MATKEIIQLKKFEEKSMSFKRWYQKLEVVFLVMETKETDKVPLLLHYIGTNLYSKLCDYMDDVNLYTQEFKVLKKNYSNYLNQKKLIRGNIQI